MVSMAGGSGSVGETASEAAFTAAHVSAATVTREQAIAGALARHAGTPTDVHLEDEGHGLQWEVKPADGGAVWEVQIDAQTGAVTSDQRDE